MNYIRHTITSGLLFIFTFIFALLPTSSAYAQIPFGGYVTFVNPICQIPPGLLVYQTPAGGPAILFYMYGTPFGVPPTPGLGMLGIALASPIPCMFYCGISVCTAGVGTLISFVKVAGT